MTNSNEEMPDIDFEKFTKAFEYILSWAILTPISIVISGKFLASKIDLPNCSENKIRIPLYFVQFSANGGEAILGMASFIMWSIFTAIFFWKKLKQSYYRTRRNIHKSVELYLRNFSIN